MPCFRLCGGHHKYEAPKDPQTALNSLYPFISVIIFSLKVRCVVRAHPPANVDWVKQGETIETGDNNEDRDESIVYNDDEEEKIGADDDDVSSLQPVSIVSPCLTQSTFAGG